MNRLFLVLLLAVVSIFQACRNNSMDEQNNSTSKTFQDSVFSMPYNKVLSPAGKQLFFGDVNLENHALDVALSPDKKTLVIEGRYSLVFVNTTHNQIVYRLIMSHYDKKNAKNTYSGITWIEEHGKQFVLWGTKNKLMKAVWNGKIARIVKSYKFNPKKNQKHALPNEVYCRKEKKVYVAYVVLNGNDEVVKLDLNSGEILWRQDVGLAPFGITMAGGNLYISNWAGSRVIDDSEKTAPIPWGKAYVDDFGSVSSGSVTVLDPKSGKNMRNIAVGLHPNHIINSPNGKFVFVANGNDDQVSVINVSENQLVENISLRLNSSKNPFFGDSPNGLAISTNGQKLYVSNGMDNAVAVVKLGKLSSTQSSESKSRILGFIPTAAYPAGLDILNDSILYVADIEGVGARLTVQDSTNKAYQTFIKKLGKRHSTAGSFNAHRMLAVVSVIPLPKKKELKNYTQIVLKNNKQERLALLHLLPRRGIQAVPVPERIGEPSNFKHVVYIIKENRTYDQVLGDIKKGNGDASLCTFGQDVTPNMHQLVQDFVLLDNFKVSGKCSAEGHLWTDASIVTDYVEKNVRAWFRSYTHVLYDAMAYPKTGFLWDNALDHGKKVRIYGETAIPKWTSGKKWLGVYRDFQAGKVFKFTNVTTIARVRNILSPNYPGYDSHNVPDVLRAKAFIDELKDYEKQEGDTFPDLCILALPNDHTGGTSPAHPTPRAMVADNDYALGQIIEALSRSRFWKNTVVFITEDDSQHGWDHVSAYRTVGTIISPYTKHSKMVSTDYNQTSMIRTMEQILGLPPMNIEDATAKPMFDVFENTADYRPYSVLKNRIPLDEMNKPLAELKGKAKAFALASMEMTKKGIDAGDDDLFNRILWSALKQEQAYPEKYSSRIKDHDED